MNPTGFPQANVVATPPSGMDETQVHTIPMFRGEYDGGNLDGAAICISAWLPTAEEINQINQGEPIFLLFVGGCPAHCPMVGFPVSIVR